jgi:hypothetical protein
VSEEIDLDQQEIWESTTGGTTFVNVKDPRNPRAWITKKVGGKGTQRITVTVEERLFNQELVTYENGDHDPFLNGLLVRISPKDAEKGENEVTDDYLIEQLRDRSDEAFTTYLKSLRSEIVLRRLQSLAERHAPMYRFNEIQTEVDARYPIGKTSRVVSEMMHDDARYAGADL